MKCALLLVAACHTTTTAPRSTSASASVTESASETTPAITATTPAARRTITIDARGIGFDDLVFASNRVLAPSGAMGTLAVIDPATLAVQTIRATDASAAPYVAGRHDHGITSAASTTSGLVVTDRTSKTLIALDPSSSSSSSKATLADEPDYVRWVAPVNEVWVTEPDSAQIEVFSPPPFKRITTFAIPGGPESLVVSASRSTAYANLWRKKSVEIDLRAHAITRSFETGCDKTRGIALDDASGLLFVACNDGRIVSVDLGTGKIAAEGRAGDGVDIIDFSPKTGRLYVPAARAGTLTVFTKGLAVVKTEPVPKGAHCVVVGSDVWVCDPDHGSLIVFAENP